VRHRQAVVRQDREVGELAILQGKDTDPTVLPYESGAILLICVAGWVVARIPQEE
jgi:protein PsiE